MKINKKQAEVRKNINKLKFIINEGIDKFCEEHDYQITYAEINSALSDVMRSNLGYELKELWKKENENE